MIRRSFASILLLLGVLALGAAPAGAQRYPDEPGDGVGDLANVLTPADADTIRKVLYALRQQPGIEVRLLTVQNITSFGTGHATPEAFATALYNEWKLGLAQNHDGVLVLLSVDDRFTRIELGDNAPPHLDAASRAIIDQQMVPRFRSGDMSGGLREGVLALAASLGGLPSAAPQAQSQPQPQPQPVYGQTEQPAPGQTEQPVFERTELPVRSSDPPISAGILLLTIVLGGAAAFLGIRALTSRRKCTQCGGELHKLDEESDDVYLDSGRRVEEVLGSVNYNVWHCAGCGHHDVQRDPAMFTRKEQCPQCKYRTVTVTRTTVQKPTYASSGSQRVEKTCGNCSWRDEDIVNLPRKQRPTTHRRSSFGSFGSRGGGGRGGGGGGSWGGGSSSGSSGGHSSGRGSSGRW